MRTISEFVGELRRRHSQAPNADSVGEALILAEAALRNCDAPERPLSIVVLGPTQVGKSSVVNVLLGASAAGVSPLAGFTIHAHGFVLGDFAAAERRATCALPDRRRVSVSELRRDRLDEFALDAVESAHALSPSVIWDTPDFDSLSAWQYQSATLELAAAADLLVLVVSKEKYSDLRVWSLLRQMDALRRPLIVCVNKTDAESVATITTSLQARLAEFMPNSRGAPLVAIPFVADGLAPGDAGAATNELRATVSNEYQRVSDVEPGRRSQMRRQSAAAIIEKNWGIWTEPLLAEVQALDAWREEVNRACEIVAESFSTGYLENSQRYDAFRRATLELIRMLEWPGVGDVLGRLRSAITWPARKLLSAGRAALRGERVVSEANDRCALREGVSRSLTRLQRDVARRLDPALPGYAVWRGLHAQLDQQRSELESRLGGEIDRMLDLLEVEIRAAAAELHERLREEPTRLNALRATRTATDVASVAIAIKTGGAPLHDLLLAPALFAMTSMLTEGALGAYVASVSDRLKRRLGQRVRGEFVDSAFARMLSDVSLGLRGSGVAVISRERIAMARAALAALTGGESVHA
ncbi:MAG: 50S ribosome-binding GTPase [Phycisphaerales bacterium]|nr:50S ribosome-binding GTPase [Phycisphaerales bacterium]